jgi:hypothetical protein
MMFASGLLTTKRVSRVNTLGRFLAASGLAALTTVPTCAIPLIDQGNLTFVTSMTSPAASSVTVTDSNQLPPTRRQAHTVTTGVSGILSRLDLQVINQFGDGALNVTIMRGNFVDPAATTLGTITIADSDLPTLGTIASLQYFTLDLSGYSFAFDAGDVFSILLRATSNIAGSRKSVGWIYGADATDLTGIPDYTGGVNYIITDLPSSQTIEQSVFDRGFRTWVEPDIINIPEPAPLLLGAFGILGITFSRRYK